MRLYVCWFLFSIVLSLSILLPDGYVGIIFFFDLLQKFTVVHYKIELIEEIVEFLTYGEA